MIRAPRRMLTFHGEYYEAQPEMVDVLGRFGIRPSNDWRAARPGTVISAAATSECRRVSVDPADEGQDIYVKIDRYPFLRALRTWLRPAKTTVEAFAYGSLQQLGVASLDTIALAERRRFGCLAGSLIVTRGVPQSIDLLEFMRERWPGMQSTERKAQFRHIGGQLIEQLRRAHGAGFVHHDLKWRNVLLQRSGEEWVCLWIDAPRASIWSKYRRERGRVIDLSDLARMSASTISIYDRMRFLRDYLGRERDPGALRHLFDLVSARVERREQRDAKRNRKA